MSDTMMILAVLLAPFIAVFAQRQIDQFREKRERKLWVFKTLMATRGAKLSFDHVRALNMIDLEFTDKSPLDEAIRNTWKEYLDHLGALIPLTAEERQDRLAAWSERADDYLAELLDRMGKRLGYSFDKVHIRKSIYSPEGHLNDEMEIKLLRRLAVDVLAGQRSLVTSVVPPNEAVAAFAAEYQKLLLAVLSGKQAVTIRAETENNS